MGEKRTKSEVAVRHGGDWTTVKLQVLADYLAAYSTALKRQKHLRRIYIDAFAGTGYRELSAVENAGGANQYWLFPNPTEPGKPESLEGSAKLALRIQPPFDQYIFIEQNAARCRELQLLADEFPELTNRVQVRHGDANTELRSICQGFHQGDRAVAFLDPFGMNVEWATIQAIARTKAVDVWILFPLGIGANRLLTRSGNISAAWQRRLTALFGTPDWRDEFYRTEEADTLFGPEEQSVKVPMAQIGAYFNQRLHSIFAGVAKEPLALVNSVNSPLYLLCFAAANPAGAKLALKIVNHLLRTHG